MLITSKENPTVKRLAKLLSSKKARRESREFVIEGTRSCYDAACEVQRGGKLVVTGFFCTEDALEKAEGSFDVSKFDSIDSRLRYTITELIAEKLSAGSSQGMFMTAQMLDKELSVSGIKAGGKYVVLADIRDPGNVGTIMRSADAFGIDGVVLAGDCCDLYNPKVIRSAMGSIARTPVYISGTAAETAAVFAEAGVVNIASVITDGTSLTKTDFSRGCAVYIGNEGRGLDPDFVKICEEKLTIAMRGSIDSLNAAMAATVILWEMTRGDING